MPQLLHITETHIRRWSFRLFAQRRRVPNVEFHGAKEGVAVPRFVVIPKWRIIMYNARTFFTVDVLVHVGAPVREVALHGKRYTRSLPPPFFPLANLFCVHFHPRSSSPASLSPASRHSSFLPPARTFAIGPWYRPRLVRTRLIQMNPRIVWCISRD